MDQDWNGFADLLASFITKYAGVLDLDNLPDPAPVSDEIEISKQAVKKNTEDIAKLAVEKRGKK